MDLIHSFLSLPYHFNPINEGKAMEEGGWKIRELKYSVMLSEYTSDLRQGRSRSDYIKNFVCNLSINKRVYVLSSLLHSVFNHIECLSMIMISDLGLYND